MKNFTAYTLFFLNLVTLAGCKHETESDQNLAPITADSSSFSTLIVSCKSSDPLSTGIAVLDVQRYFLSKNIVESTIKGKLFSIKTASDGDFKAVIDKTTLDFQTPESYFKNYDSFVALVDDRFKTKTGFQKSYDLTQQQVEQLIDGQDLTLAYQSRGRKPVFFASSLLLSAGLGTVQAGAKAPANVIFTLSRFQSTLNISSRVLGVVRNYGRLGHFFVDPAVTIRHTANTQGSQIFVASYNSTGNLGGYSYTYPLPPSPAPIFGAPVWYWHRYTRPSTGQTFTVFPPNVSTSGFDITNFSLSPVPLTKRVNATIVGSTVDMVYTAGAPYNAEIGLSDPIDVSNGFESTYDFSITKSSIIDNKDYQSINLKIESANGSYNDFGIGLYGGGTVGLIGWLGTKTINKTVPSVNDGKVHRIKAVIRNSGTSTIAQIFLDDMTNPIQQITYANSIYNYLLFTYSNTLRRVAIQGYNNPVRAGAFKLHSWSFQTL